jgi:enediyne biosynthesis protein E4
VTARTGTGNAGGWGVSAAFVDYDRDGWLDLFVGNYLEYAVATDVDCRSVAGRPDYCPPGQYTAQRDRLVRNRGDGTFEDATARALVGGAYGPALGVSTADFDDDGWMDVYVANDGQPNQLWINQGDGTFRDRAFVAGVAVSGAGVAEASMGVDAGDYDNDGDEDLFITNWLSQMHTLYANRGDGLFEDRKAASGLGPPTLSKTAFGAAWLDADNDGWLDLVAASGSVSTIEAQARAGDRFPFRMTHQLFRNLQNGRFADVSGRAGTPFAAPSVGRGMAVGDVDNDGDLDVLVGNDSGPLQLLINGAAPARWLGLRLLTASGRDALGARVEVAIAGGRPVWRRARADGSYASANDPRVHVGLGATAGPVRVRVQWPDGTSDDWRDLATGQWTTVRQEPLR